MQCLYRAAVGMGMKKYTQLRAWFESYDQSNVLNQVTKIAIIALVSFPAADCDTVYLCRQYWIPSVLHYHSGFTKTILRAQQVNSFNELLIKLTFNFNLDSKKNENLKCD